MPAADPVGQLEVVGHDGIRLGQALEVLAQPRVERGDAGLLERDRRALSASSVSPGMNFRTARFMNHRPGRCVLQPAVPGGPQEDPPHALLLHGSVIAMLRDDAG